MSTTALEILINGEKLYVAGAEGWQTLGTNIVGQKFSEESRAQIQEEFGTVAGVTDRSDEELTLFSYVGLPNPNSPGSSESGNYEPRTLVVGDEIRIRVIKTDRPDLPGPTSNNETDWGLYSGNAENEKT